MTNFLTPLNKNLSHKSVYILCKVQLQIVPVSEDTLKEFHIRSLIHGVVVSKCQVTARTSILDCFILLLHQLKTFIEREWELELESKPKLRLYKHLKQLLKLKYIFTDNTDLF